MLVDVHTHLTHEQFDLDRHQVILDAERCGLERIIVNGLNPPSNRQILELAKNYPIIRAALGIYPVDAINHLAQSLPFAVNQFDVKAEIAFIEQHAKARTITAIGECGLDGHWLGKETYPEQERVFEALIDIALRHELPLIIHSRSCETRCHDILRAMGVTRVDFHCYGGPSRDALKWAESNGWYFSIPANATRNQAFQKLLKELPAERILTETDAPYLPPQKGERNTPCNVSSTIGLLASLRGWTIETAASQVFSNYKALFEP